MRCKTIGLKWMSECGSLIKLGYKSCLERTHRGDHTHSERTHNFQNACDDEQHDAARQPERVFSLSSWNSFFIPLRKQYFTATLFFSLKFCCEILWLFHFLVFQLILCFHTCFQLPVCLPTTSLFSPAGQCETPTSTFIPQKKILPACWRSIVVEFGHITSEGPQEGSIKNKAKPLTILFTSVVSMLHFCFSLLAVVPPQSTHKDSWTAHFERPLLAGFNIMRVINSSPSS